MAKDCHGCEEYQEVVDRIIKLLDIDFASPVSYLPGVVLKEVTKARDTARSATGDLDGAVSEIKRFEVENRMLNNERDRLFRIVQEMAAPGLEVGTMRVGDDPYQYTNPRGTAHKQNNHDKFNN